MGHEQHFCTNLIKKMDGELYSAFIVFPKQIFHRICLHLHAILAADIILLCHAHKGQGPIRAFSQSGKNPIK
jgi:hypothetical protein